MGDKSGPPAVVHWLMPSVLPALIPWFILVGLMLTPSNRCRGAWWICVPVGVLALGAKVLPMFTSGLQNPVDEVCLGLFEAVGFAMACVWLLGGWLGPRHRLLTLLGMVLVGGCFGGVRVCTSDWSSDSAGIVTAVCSGIGVLVLALGLTLTGRLCRKQYRPFRLLAWLVAWVVVFWTLVVLPFSIPVILTRGGGVEAVKTILQAFVVFVGATLGAVLPCLLLSFLNGFYRARLQNLLKVGLEVAAPPVIKPVEPVIPA